MRLDEIIVAEIQRDRSLKIFKLFAECVREASQTAAMHPQRVILLFNVRRANPIHVRHTGHNLINGCLINGLLVADARIW